MAQRLTEKDIHTACSEIAALGELPTALTTKMTGLEESHKNTLEEKQRLQQHYDQTLKQKEVEIHTAILESEKKISNLEGQLAAYKSLDKTEN